MAQIKGTNVASPVVPFDTADVHPSHEARYGRGGYRTVATTAERDAIPAPRREAGMLVYVVADQTIYTLGANLTTWDALELGGGQPDAHAATHGATGSDPVTVSVGQVTGLQTILDAKATSADVTNAVNAVIDAAPAALNTLNELAAALGDDANFASTVTNALAGKAASVHTHAASDIDSGTLSASRLPIAASGSLGCVRIGSGISIDGSGVISASSGYTLPIATANTLGGVKIGSGITITDGVISVSSGSVAWNDITSKPSTFAPSAHAASHAVGGADPVFDQDLNTADSPTFYNLTVDNDVFLTNNNGAAGSLLFVSGANAVSFLAIGTEGQVLRVNSGATDVEWVTLGGAAALNVGTTAGTVAAGNHTHTQLHDRSHAITSSSDHTATAWRVFYSDGSGAVTELSLGSAGQALLSNGATAAPSWGSAGSNSASDLTTGTLANARMTTRARASMNLYLWSSFR